MKAFFVALVILSLPAWAGEYQDYIDIKRELLDADKAYMEYVNAKRKQAVENSRGLEEFYRAKELREWNYEKSRREYVRERDAKQRLPASVQNADEINYERELAQIKSERERDRQKHVYLRELREQVREEIGTNAPPEVRKRNDKPWDSD